MPRAKRLIAGLEVLLKYDHSGWCDAEKGILWGPKGIEVPRCRGGDEDKLIEYGWCYDDGRQRWYAHT